MTSPPAAPDVTRPDDLDHDDHRRTVRRMFDLVAPRYDLLNDLMSGGTHRLWKDTLARRAGHPVHGPGKTGRALDLAGGTGDIARRLDDLGWQVTVLDPSPEMMAVGQRRLKGRPVEWVAGFAENPPFPEASFDLITIAFGLRNVSQRAAALAAAHRLLTPGGRFLCLEFSQPLKLIAGPYEWYTRTIIPRLGALISGQPEAYSYLDQSIHAFPEQRALKTMMEQAGFTDVSWRNQFLGIAALHEGTRAA
ncbi:ubiquinone/menaquinone biosynthesis methyltransferase [Roseospirillum parvum]|uniref:Ubiquinone/menaquinone biosynthesis C-methyltransferase UbiE n=1 Tax=Roseospirillum parvum TaxID=83401 RepID=A0A1G8FQ37_9PROT|nr:ubiquinone/menaquinone biosynthesis methyltransferase [Roseospirillum parvum]SDH84209.1 demethylmenaquinone methyltransferase / 2-methoxy-6-polyprenyl-1,4-benzoquinol methylase [Roseospirillum parvum]